MLKNVFLILSLAIACQAEVAFPGPCPYILPRIFFDSRLFYDRWYEVEKYSTPFRPEGKCVSTLFYPTVFGPFYTTYTQVDTLTNTPSSIMGTVTQEGLYYESRFSAVYQGNPIPLKYMVLDTDYLTYAVFYSCANFNLFHYKYVWVLTKKRDLPITYSSFVLDFYGIPRVFLKKTDHSNCPVIP